MQKLKCSGCGQWLDESTDREADGTFDAEVFVCHSCRALHDRLGAASKDRDHSHGIYGRVIG